MILVSRACGVTLSQSFQQEFARTIVWGAHPIISISGRSWIPPWPVLAQPMNFHFIALVYQGADCDTICP
ncbi:hypothetical protein BAE36_27770 [Rhizobium leguminosarum bv. trifolii]|nr:hypothetical protein BAE36_27770 [Rhizobium leguminosarum bv. trifolii]